MSAGALDPHQASLLSSLDYTLWHTTDFAGSDTRGNAAKNPLQAPLRTTQPDRREKSIDEINPPGTEVIYGKASRNFSPAFKPGRKPAIRQAPQRPATSQAIQEYSIDPWGRAKESPAIQKGEWTYAQDGKEPPSLASSWKWRFYRNVGNDLTQTFYTRGDTREPGVPSWSVHFGLAATKPTFGKLKAPMSEHAATCGIAEEMAMDQKVFSPFRTALREDLSTPNRTRPVSRAASVKSGSRLSPLPTSGRASATAGTATPKEHGSVYEIDTGTDRRLVMTRSCQSIDGINNTIVTLPPNWSHLSRLIKSEQQARSQVKSRSRLEILREKPKGLMQSLNATMKAHPDSPWQHNCFPM